MLKGKESIKVNELLGKITNPKVNVFYDEHYAPYLALEFDTHLFDEKGMKQKATIQIHKIKLDSIILNNEARTTQDYKKLFPISYEPCDKQISFNLGENDKGDILTCEFEEK